DGKVAPRQIFVNLVHEEHCVRSTAVAVANFAAQGRDLVTDSASQHGDRAMLDSGRDDALEQPLNRLGASVAGQVPIGLAVVARGVQRRAQLITQGASDYPGSVPCVIEYPSYLQYLRRYGSVKCCQGLRVELSRHAGSASRKESMQQASTLDGLLDLSTPGIDDLAAADARFGLGWAALLRRRVCLTLCRGTAHGRFRLLLGDELDGMAALAAVEDDLLGLEPLALDAQRCAFPLL